MVRRASLLALPVVTALAGQAASAVAAAGFGDRFDSLDAGRWSTGDHRLGRSRLDPAALYLNSWFPAWPAGAPSPGAATLVDRVDATT